MDDESSPRMPDCSRVGNSPLSNDDAEFVNWRGVRSVCIRRIQAFPSMACGPRLERSSLPSLPLSFSLSCLPILDSSQGLMLSMVVIDLQLYHLLQ